MSEMIDRMAKAAYEAQRARFNPTVTEGPDYELHAWEDEGEGLREDWRQFMRDGLTTAREPTKEMVLEARRYLFQGQSETNIEAAWEAMIDAALKEE